MKMRALGSNAGFSPHLKPYAQIRGRRRRSVKERVCQLGAQFHCPQVCFPARGGCPCAGGRVKGLGMQVARM